MFNSCICLDVAEYPDVLHESIVTARKHHVCCECREAISPGEKYELVKHLQDGEWSTIRTCLPCSRVRKSLFECGCYYGEMWGEIHEVICTNDPDESEDDDEEGDGQFCICPL